MPGTDRPGLAQHSVANGAGIARAVHLVRGALGELHARRFLRARGLQVLACNVRYRCGEIDIVAREGDTLVFVEVRRRRDPAAAARSIDSPKRGKIRRAAQCYLQVRFGDRWPPCRFDVILLGDDRLRWLKNAFGADEERRWGD